MTDLQNEEKNTSLDFSQWVALVSNSNVFDRIGDALKNLLEMGIIETQIVTPLLDRLHKLEIGAGMCNTTNPNGEWWKELADHPAPTVQEIEALIGDIYHILPKDDKHGHIKKQLEEATQTLHLEKSSTKWAENVGSETKSWRR